MFISFLLIDVGVNPDRPRPGRLWLRNLYHVHQRLCMAFPSISRKENDGDFLHPFRPEDFGEGQVHVERKENAGFLFRIDPLPAGRAAIIVQSAIKPDWDYAFRNAEYLLAALPLVKTFNPTFTKGEQLRFRLLANATKRLHQKSQHPSGTPLQEKWIGKRVPVPKDQLKEWLQRKADLAGFALEPHALQIQPGYIYMNKPSNGKARLFAVRYEGILTVKDPQALLNAIAAGIGPGKAFGFGLLTLAPLPSGPQQPARENNPNLLLEVKP